MQHYFYIKTFSFLLTKRLQIIGEKNKTSKKFIRIKKIKKNPNFDIDIGFESGGLYYIVYSVHMFFYIVKKYRFILGFTITGEREGQGRTSDVFLDIVIYRKLTSSIGFTNTRTPF